MQRPKINALLLGLFMLLVVTAIVLTTWGLLTHQEPGFADDTVRWDHVPISVACAPAEECASVEGAVHTVNARVGFELLYWQQEHPANIDVQVNVAFPVGGDWDTAGGQFILRGSGGHYTRCEIQTSNIVGPDDLEHLVLQHELGHCLGLAHDDFNSSIMRRTQVETPWGEMPPRFTDSDVELLRAAYR